MSKEAFSRHYFLQEVAVTPNRYASISLSLLNQGQSVYTIPLLRGGK